MNLVLDSTVALAWVYAGESRPAVEQVLERVSQAGAWVPAFWRLEVAQRLETGLRLGRHDAAFRDATLADLALLPIHVDPDTDAHAWEATLKLASRYRLTLNAAAYLELAQRRGLPLATLDAEMRRAAASEGIKLLGA
jgi:predicted nucleic acid-binding protein